MLSHSTLAFYVAVNARVLCVSILLPKGFALEGEARAVVLALLVVMHHVLEASVTLSLDVRQSVHSKVGHGGHNSCGRW